MCVFMQYACMCSHMCVHNYVCMFLCIGMCLNMFSPVKNLSKALCIIASVMLFFFWYVANAVAFHL